MSWLRALPATRASMRAQARMDLRVRSLIALT
jgi:hypothetical protein